MTEIYKRQGCTLHPDFIPGNLLIYEDGYKYIPFDDTWQKHTIVYFCP